MSKLNTPLRDVVDSTISTEMHLCRVPTLFKLLRVKSDFGPYEIFIDETHKQVIATALCETKYSDPGVKEPATAPNRATLLATTIATFNAMRKSEQLAFLDKLWARCYEAAVPATPATSMIDKSGTFSILSGQLTSSLRPVNREIAKVALAKGPVDTAWSKYHVGFRIDGGKARSGSRDDLARVRDSGSQPLVMNTPLALRVAKKAYAGLAASKGTHIYLGYQNRDVYNESGTCVSRTLIGATAFPYRETVTATDQAGLAFHYLFAYRCDDLVGCDTEQWQLDKKAPWRPGEKAFIGVPADHVLAYTRVIRHGQKGMGLNGKGELSGWSFEFMDSQWTWVNTPNTTIKTYLEEELAAWKPKQVYHVPLEYDFMDLN